MTSCERLLIWYLSSEKVRRKPGEVKQLVELNPNLKPGVFSVPKVLIYDIRSLELPQGLLIQTKTWYQSASVAANALRIGVERSNSDPFIGALIPSCQALCLQLLKG